MNNKILLSVAIGSSAFSLTSYAQKNAQKPNIVYILADDMGRAELNSYGQQLIETPNLNELEKRGMMFSNHYSGSAVSAPSRCSLFTGLHMGHAYIRGNDPMAERGNVWDHQAMYDDPSLEGQRPLPAETVMIPAKLKEAGYTTACIGKWGLGYPGSESTANKMGFDFFYGYNCQRQAHTYYPPFLYKNEERVYLNNKVLNTNSQLAKGADPLDTQNYAEFQQNDYAPELMQTELIDFVEREQKNPFALFWTTPLPHVPLQAPQRWIDYYVDKFGDEEPYLGQSSYFPSRYPRATYAAMVSYFDEQIGELILKLKELGVYENTLIIFTSDNGPTFNGGSDSRWFDSAKPFKSEGGWGKASLKEGGIRAPMLAVWENVIEAGSQSDHLSAFWDIMPTLCEVAQVATPTTDGISMLPTFMGKVQKEHKALYWEFVDGNGGSVAVRKGKWKGLIEDLQNGNEQIKLFNLELDPREQTDLSRYFPDVVEDIKRIMKQEHTTPQVKSFSFKRFIQ